MKTRNYAQWQKKKHDSVSLQPRPFDFKEIKPLSKVVSNNMVLISDDGQGVLWLSCRVSCVPCNHEYTEISSFEREVGKITEKWTNYKFLLTRYRGLYPGEKGEGTQYHERSITGI